MDKSLAAVPVQGINYQQLEHERVLQSRAALRQKLKHITENDLGRAGSLRRIILSIVVQERYDDAKEEILKYVARRAEYPNFADKVEKFVHHASDLIIAVQTKRTFPGLGTLSLTKQQELNERVLTHFEELKQTLKAIERAEKEVKLSDLRSTVWVIRTTIHCSLAILIVAFFMHLQRGLLYSFLTVLNAFADDFTRYFCRMIGW